MCEVGSQFLAHCELSLVRESTVQASPSLSLTGIIIERTIAVAIQPNLLAASTA
jgi:hypothetical protein